MAATSVHYGLTHIFSVSLPKTWAALLPRQAECRFKLLGVSGDDCLNLLQLRDNLKIFLGTADKTSFDHSSDALNTHVYVMNHHFPYFLPRPLAKEDGLKHYYIYVVSGNSERVVIEIEGTSFKIPVHKGCQVYCLTVPDIL